MLVSYFSRMDGWYGLETTYSQKIYVTVAYAMGKNSSYDLLLPSWIVEGMFLNYGGMYEGYLLSLDTDCKMFVREYTRTFCNIFREWLVISHFGVIIPHSSMTSTRIGPMLEVRVYSIYCSSNMAELLKLGWSLYPIVDCPQPACTLGPLTWTLNSSEAFGPYRDKAFTWKIKFDHGSSQSPSSERGACRWIHSFNCSRKWKHFPCENIFFAVTYCGIYHGAHIGSFMKTSLRQQRATSAPARWSELNIIWNWNVHINSINQHLLSPFYFTFPPSTICWLTHPSPPRPHHIAAIHIQASGNRSNMHLVRSNHQEDEPNPIELLRGSEVPAGSGSPQKQRTVATEVCLRRDQPCYKSHKLNPTAPITFNQSWSIVY